MNSSRLLGIILTIVALGLTLIAALWLATQVNAGQLEVGGALVGALVAFIPIALLLGAGVYLYIRGGAEAAATSVMHQQRRLMDIVKSRGQVGVDELAMELGSPVTEIKDMVHQLVGLQVFSGYINWDEGTLYSVDADQLRELKQCKNCGGNLKLAGKGVVVCPYCGTEYFLR